MGKRPGLGIQFAGWSPTAGDVWGFYDRPRQQRSGRVVFGHPAAFWANDRKRFEKMPTGKISHYDSGRGFGFIIPDDGGQDIFVHAKYLVNADILKRDQRVSFEIALDNRRNKPRADRVRVIDGVAHTADGFDAIAYDNDFLLNAP